MIRARVDGADRLADTMTRAGRDLRTMPGAGRKAGALVVDAAQRLAPRRTGRLRASIRVDTGKDGSATVTAGGHGVRYAGVQEHGSRRMGIKPTHFMARAADTTAGDVGTVYRSEVSDILDTVKGA